MMLGVNVTKMVPFPLVGTVTQTDTCSQSARSTETLEDVQRYTLISVSFAFFEMLEVF